MSTATPVMLEFRCTRCWRSNCVDSDACGSTIPCQNCGEEVTVPDATPERIARAEALLKEEPSLAERPNLQTSVHSTTIDDRELVRIANEQAKVPLHLMDFSGYGQASIIARTIAYLIDNTLTFLSVVFGFVLAVILAKYGLGDDPFDSLQVQEAISISASINIFSLPLMLCIVQWILMSTSGQTIGKKIMMIRIVGMSGRIPGFIQVVILRNWVRYLLSVIPFFSQIDLLFALGDSGRTIHDWISGTRVIEVA